MRTTIRGAVAVTAVLGLLAIAQPASATRSGSGLTRVSHGDPYAACADRDAAVPSPVLASAAALASPTALAGIRQRFRR